MSDAWVEGNGSLFQPHPANQCSSSTRVFSPYNEFSSSENHIGTKNTLNHLVIIELYKRIPFRQALSLRYYYAFWVPHTRQRSNYIPPTSVWRNVPYV